MINNKAEAAINAVANSAERVSPGWIDKATEAFRTVPLLEFQVEHVREWAYSMGLPTPPSDRAWGAPTAKAKKLGYIEFKGFAVANHGLSHNMPARVWQKDRDISLINIDRRCRHSDRLRAIMKVHIDGKEAYPQENLVRFLQESIELPEDKSIAILKGNNRVFSAGIARSIEEFLGLKEGVLDVFSVESPFDEVDHQEVETDDAPAP